MTDLLRREWLVGASLSLSGIAGCLGGNRERKTVEIPINSTGSNYTSSNSGEKPYSDDPARLILKAENSTHSFAGKDFNLWNEDETIDTNHSVRTDNDGIMLAESLETGNYVLEYYCQGEKKSQSIQLASGTNVYRINFDECKSELEATPENRNALLRRK